MTKYLLITLILWSCSESSSVHQQSSTQKTQLHSSNSPKSLQETLNGADSVVIASHYSPNEPIEDHETGKRLPPFKVIVNNKLNESIVKERKKLDQKDIEELGNILTAPAIEDSVNTMCFQPRNGIFAYKAGKLSYLDICFDCFGFAAYGDFRSVIIDAPKYKKLMEYYKKHEFTYMLD